LRLGDVLSRAAFGTIGYLAAPDDLERLERYIVHNLPVLRACAGVVVATNYGGETRDELAAEVHAVWRRHVPECVLLDSPLDRGHSIGTCDLDNLLFDHCKAAGVRTLCKTADDVLLDPSVLDIQVADAGLYYLNAVSYDALAEHEFDLARFAGDRFFFPQTNFYVIDVSKTDYLVDKRFLDLSWTVVNRIRSYDGRIWEHIPRWSCELLLRKCALRNRLTRCHLMSDDQWARVLALVHERRITDCSLKNVRVNGICHVHEHEAPWPVVDVGPPRPETCV
jgi:hypothetical protein